MPDNVGGMIDDLFEAARWRPILALLKTARGARGAARAAAIRDVAEFALKTLDVDPYKSRPFLIVALVAELATTDTRVASLVDELLPPR